MSPAHEFSLQNSIIREGFFKALEQYHYESKTFRLGKSWNQTIEKESAEEDDTNNKEKDVEKEDESNNDVPLDPTS